MFVRFALAPTEIAVADPAVVEGSLVTLPSLNAFVATIIFCTQSDESDKMNKKSILIHFPPIFLLHSIS